MTQALKMGESISSQLLPVILAAEEAATNTHNEKVQFWAGLIAHNLGHMAASIGPESFSVLASVLPDILEEAISNQGIKPPYLKPVKS